MTIAQAIKSEHNRNGRFALYSCRSNDNLDLPKADTAYVVAEPQPITSVYMFESRAVRQTPPITAQIGQLSH